MLGQVRPSRERRPQLNNLIDAVRGLREHRTSVGVLPLSPVCGFREHEG